MKIPKEIEFTEDFEIRTKPETIEEYYFNEIYTLHIKDNVDNIELKYIGESGEEITNAEEVLEYLYYLRLQEQENK